MIVTDDCDIKLTFLRRQAQIRSASKTKSWPARPLNKNWWAAHSQSIRRPWREPRPALRQAECSSHPAVPPLRATAWTAVAIPLGQEPFLT